MTGGQSRLEILTHRLPFASTEWQQLLAGEISHLSSPPFLGLAGSMLIAYTLATPSAWLWACVYILLAACPPVVYILWHVEHGKIADLDIRLRAQRVRPFLLAIGSAAISWAVLYWSAAPPPLVTFAAVTGTELALLPERWLYWFGFTSITRCCPRSACLSWLGPASRCITTRFPRAWRESW